MIMLGMMFKYLFLGIWYCIKYTFVGMYYAIYYTFKYTIKGICFACKWIYGLFDKSYQSSVFRSLELEDVDDMDGHDFEYYVQDLLKKNGFIDVKVTQGSADHGIDVLAIKNGKTYAIQCKRYNNKVGNKAVQEAYSGRDLYGADIGVVVTNQYFTKQAIGDAKRLGVELWDRETLYNMIHNGNRGD